MVASILVSSVFTSRTTSVLASNGTTLLLLLLLLLLYDIYVFTRLLTPYAQTGSGVLHSTPVLPHFVGPS
jgi:hypothetical protein